MNNEKINIFDNIADLCKSFTLLLKQLTETQENVNVALSGGTTPNQLFTYWSETSRESMDWKRISFFWGDERCVAPDDAMSNFGVASHFLFDKVPEIPRENIYRVLGENDPEVEAKRYGDFLAEKVPLKAGVPSFDLIMLGMGDDGHTASIFPNQISLWNATSNCIVAEHPQTGMKRVSFTGRVINQARQVAFLVTGENKSEKVKAVIEKRAESRTSYPAALVDPKEGDLLWFLDKAAAKLLS